MKNFDPESCANATDPTDDEVARLMARRLTTARRGPDPRARAWAAATEPREAEVARVLPDVAGFSQAAAVTDPSDAEVARLLARLSARERPSRSWLPGVAMRGSMWVAPLVPLAIAAAALIWAGQPSSPAESWDPGEVTELRAEVALGPSIRVQPHDPQSPPHLQRVSAPGVNGGGDGATRVSVLQGAARFEVDPLGVQRDLRVWAGDVEVRVKGTVFSVERVGDRVEVAVERGRVEVAGPHGIAHLIAGQTWTNQVSPEAAAPIALDTPRVAVAEVGPEVAPRLAAAPHLAAAPVTSPVVKVERDDSRPPMASPPQSTPGSPVEPPAARAAVEAEPPTPAAPSDPGPPPRAIADLEQLRVIQRHLRTRADAASALAEVRQFLSSDPDPHLIPVARELAVDAALTLGDPVQFDEAADALLADRPHHPRADQIRWLQGRSRMSRGGCAEANPYFAQAASGSTTHAGRASVDYAACLESVGDRPGAEAVLRRAIRLDLPEDVRVLVEERLDRVVR